jgi:hypothetical protein
LKQAIAVAVVVVVVGFECFQKGGLVGLFVCLMDLMINLFLEDFFIF